ncbi:MAG TPA: M20 family metallopeptidase [Spirochaetales bacterium]|nr:M20 family metallopeptidase [Spirochaetales bacterium]
MDFEGMNALTARATVHRRALHRIPETGLELPETVRYVRTALEAAGIAPRDCGGGLLADIGDAGPLVAIRADMDALAVTEATGLPFSSAHPGAMHACGHDAHTGALLACAERYAASPPEGFRVRLLFQPGEEGYFGARGMIADGCLDGVEAIVGSHVGHLSDELSPGQAGFLPGPMMAASDLFSGAFVGSGGHGSAPHQALDPIPALAEFVLALQSFRSRAPDQREPFVLSVCELSAGSAYNIIPCEAGFGGTVRSLSPTLRAMAKDGIARACAGVAAAHGLRHRFDWVDGYPPLVNDAWASSLAMDAAIRAIGAEDVRELTAPSMGGEDFAYYLAKVPGCFWFLDTQPPGSAYPNHHPRFDIDERFLGRLAMVDMAIAASIANGLR